MRAAVVLAAALAALHAPAFHVQFGVGAKHNGVPSSYYTSYGRNLSTPYLWATKEVGATPGYIPYLNFVDLFTAVRVKNDKPGIGIIGDDTYYKGVRLKWDDPDDTGSVTLYGNPGIANLGTVEIAEVVRLDGVSTDVSEIVLTVRGDPFSTVFNATGRDLTINGVAVSAGSGERLKFPIYLKMDEIEGVRFYDLDSAEELTATYSDGAYLIGWTGNIRVSDRPDPDTSIAGASDERLVYGDLAAANADSLLFATNGSPIYSMGKMFGTNVALNVWWDFDQDEWGQPAAYINDSVVCPSHATGHIVSYVVSDINPNSSPETRVVYFTASLIPSGSKTGGACAIKCYGKDEGDYAQVPSNHKAEVEAWLNTARFKLTIGPYGLWWKVEAATD